MDKKFTILITNDDGIDAEGIFSLYTALKNYDAEILVIAPYEQQSGMALATSVARPLLLREHFWGDKTVYSVNGTPADCVKVGINCILQQAPDLVVSGINCGTNHGRTVLYSGTVGGAIEAALRHIPGIAFSAYDIEETLYKPFLPYIPHIVDYVRSSTLPQGTLLNVSFPSHRVLHKETPKGVKLTKQGRQYWLENPIRNESSHIFLNAELCAIGEEDAESDTIWLNKGYITCSPVHVGDLTDTKYFESKKEHFENSLGFLCQSQ